MERSTPARRRLRVVPILAALAAIAAGAPPPEGQVPAAAVSAAPDPTSGAAADPAAGARLYRSACGACHGADGTGMPRTAVGFEEPLPDFTDCGFATREPNADWMAVAHDGGPARGFVRMMPAFGGALSEGELALVLTHMRTLCRDDAWPRGELNLPRPLVTEKAFPEDELVYGAAVAAEGDGAVENELVWEKRLGARNQFEFVLPFGWRERGAGGDPSDWDGGLGDVAVAVKRALWHDLGRGSILSVTGEVILPTGDQDEGLGKGYTVFEPFVTFGRILPGDGFLHLQGGGEIPIGDEDAAEEAFLRAALGKSFTEGRWGRTWSPMVEVLAARELASGESVQWDAVPQLQVTLNTRQHVMANLGVRIPFDDPDRDAEVLFYLLWDWFDGGFLEGW